MDMVTGTAIDRACGATAWTGNMLACRFGYLNKRGIINPLGTA